VNAVASEGTRTFAVVTDESTARYVVEETFLDGAQERLGIAAGLVDTIGESQVVDGSLTLDFSQSPIALQAGNFTVDISALQSDQSMRDNTLQDRWLESGTYPIASFVASGLENFPAEYMEGTEVSFQMVGDITIRDITQPVTWDVTATLADGTISGTAVAPLTMTDFGFDPPDFGGVFTVEDAFEVEVDFVAAEQ
jgi:polyisoprenoid-binding protein YceI